MGQRLISFTGAQSSGKTTLLKKLQEEDKEKNFYFINEVTRALDTKVVKINNNAEDYNLTQSLIINSHIDNFFIQSSYVMGSDIIMDRCIVDGYIYTYHLYNEGKVSHHIVKFAEYWFRQLISRYDYIFYTDPRDVELEDDGIRSTDIKFREEIIRLYDKYLLGFYYPNVIVLSGSVEERLETIHYNLKPKIKCKLCQQPTIYEEGTTIKLNQRKYYIENSGQYCEKCYTNVKNIL